MKRSRLLLGALVGVLYLMPNAGLGMNRNAAFAKKPDKQAQGATQTKISADEVNLARQATYELLQKAQNPCDELEVDAEKLFNYIRRIGRWCSNAREFAGLIRDCGQTGSFVDAGDILIKTSHKWAGLFDKEKDKRWLGYLMELYGISTENELGKNLNFWSKWPRVQICIATT